MRSPSALLPALVLSLAFAAPAWAGPIRLAAVIDGVQAGTGSTATGFAAMALDDTTKRFSWDIRWEGLLGDLTVAHFHGPALPGATAGVQVDIRALSTEIGSPIERAVGSAILTADQAADLLDGLWYVNIHSTRDPGGEIRGQVTRVAEPAVLALLGLPLLLLGFRRRN